MTRWLVAVLAFAVLAVALVGCGGAKSPDEATSREAASTATAETTATAPADSGGATAPAADTGTTPPGEVDTANLQAELEAIQRELDAMTLPDDTDFGDIESALQ